MPSSSVTPAFGRLAAFAQFQLSAPLFAWLLTVSVVSGDLAAQEWSPQLDQRIDESSIRAPLSFLADDLLEGRGVGSRGDALTRLYLRTQLELFGAEPAGLEGGFEQPVPILGITATVTSPLTLRGPQGELPLSAPDDYTAFAASPEAATAWRDAEVVFVGYGITAPEEDWDDFKDVDVRGKVVLVMNNDPEDDPELFAGPRRLYYGRWSYKYEEAARRGAVGAIVIHTTHSAGYPFQVIQTGQGREQFWLPFNDEEPRLQVRSWCSEGAARAMAKLGGEDLDELRARAESRDFRPVPLGVTASIETRNEVREIQSANVLGLVRGSDPELRDEVVVVTAHFDHLGIGREKNGDSIYNGALDNASGSAAALNLARVVSEMPVAPKRSVLFCFVTAEESGLLGSLYFAQNPTWPVKDIAANLNIDGINIWGATNDLEMIGYGKNSLSGVAEAIAERRGRRIEPNKQVELGLFYRSDHFSFARIGVPAAYFKSGTDFLENAAPRRRIKASYTATRYHQPNDEFDSRWKLDGAVEDTRLILECLLRIANDDQAPTWTEDDEFAGRR